MGLIKFKEPFRPVLLNLTVSVIEKLDVQATALGWSRSDLVRHILNSGLISNDTTAAQ
jgi:hypothetical protein